MMRKLFVVGALILLSACGADSDDGAVVSPTTTSGDVTSGTVDGVADVTVALPPLVSVPVDDLGTNHVNPPVSFDQSPSIGGDHYGFWQNCGFYDVDVLEGAATHTMEHGAVWITYNSDAMTAADLAVLESLAADDGKLLVSPYPHDDPIVLSAWGVQQRGVQSASSPEVAAFVELWKENPELTEAMVRCDGAAGIPPNDIRTLADGAQVPAEFD
jgi:hypothetical protein